MFKLSIWGSPRLKISHANKFCVGIILRTPDIHRKKGELVVKGPLPTRFYYVHLFSFGTEEVRMKMLHHYSK